METLRKGDDGTQVKTLQRTLSMRGFYCVVDGDFGPSTDAQVRLFQTKNGLTADGIVGPVTWDALATFGSEPPDPIPPILQHAQTIGYEIWGDPWRLWLFGIRSKTRKANSFDDMMGCAYVDDDGLWKMHFWPATCDPGTYWLENPSRVEGTAILACGQYEAWEIDKHAGKYEALCQRAAPVRVYRDGNRDNELDLDESTIVEGYFGINLHASTRRDGAESSRVDKWSAGCQVHATERGFAEMMELAHKQIEKTGRTTFTYSLMDQWWI